MAGKRLWIAGGLAAALAVAGGVWWAVQPRLREAPLENIPAGSSAVLQVRPAQVLGSALFDALVRKPGRDTSMKEVEKRCGTNPLLMFRHLSLFVAGDETGDLKEVGYLGEGSFDQEKLIHCVSRVVEADGGSVQRVTVLDMPAVAGGQGDSRALFYGRHAVIGGNEALLTRTIGAIRGEAPSLAADALLMDLWRRVSPKLDVVLVARVPARWNAPMRVALAGSAALAPGLVEISAAEAVGVGIDLTDGVSMDVALRFPNDGQAQSVAEGIKAFIAKVLGTEQVRLSVMGPVLKAASVGHEPYVVTVRAAVGREVLPSVLELAMGMPGATVLPGMQK